MATATSVFLGEIVFMNWYYHSRLGLDIPKLLRGLLKGIGPALVGAVAVCTPLALLMPRSWLALAVGVFAYVLVAGIAVHRFGLNSSEWAQVNALVRSIRPHGRTDAV